MYEELQKKLGYEWQDVTLLELAFAHTSWANEQTPKVQPNERLEFLGDSVLDIVSAEFLMVTMPEVREGVLSQKRANLVKTCALAARARELGVGHMLRVGRGAEYIREVEKVLADTMEAIVGAAYQDGGIDAARTVALMAGILR